MYQGFEAVYDKNSHILILGSFPSVKSRAAGFYYGNPQNRFWRMLAQVFKEEIPADIPGKIEFLKRHNIALWDAVQESDLEGSMDSSLEKSQMITANFEKIFKTAKIEKILCNGKTAYNIFTKGNFTNLPCICMPSTSPANPRYSFETWQKELLS